MNHHFSERLAALERWFCPVDESITNERTNLLANACGEDPEIFAAVESLDGAGAAVRWLRTDEALPLRKLLAGWLDKHRVAFPGARITRLRAALFDAGIITPALVPSLNKNVIAGGVDFIQLISDERGIL